MRDAIEVKISTDMPLPTPRSVSSSPSHMMTAVPAVMVTMRTMIRGSESSGMSGTLQPGSRLPLRASAMMPVLCRTASAIVRYRVYCVIFAWPLCPSFLSSSRRGITTVSSWTMIELVMYGMIPSANTLSCSSAPPENRFTSPYRLLPWTPSRQVRTFW